MLELDPEEWIPEDVKELLSKPEQMLEVLENSPSFKSNKFSKDRNIIPYLKKTLTMLSKKHPQILEPEIAEVTKILLQ